MAIDIFIPYYGRPDYLKEAVLSVLCQTNPNWKLTVVDDGYPSDEAERFLGSIQDPRVKYLKNSKNLGVTGNFNKCIELSDQEHCVILGFDDRLKSNFVEEVSALIARYPESAVYQIGVEVINAEGIVYNPLPDRIKSFLRPEGQQTQLLDSGSALTSLLRGNWLYFPSIVWKSSFLKRFGFNEHFSIVQDLDLITKILLADGELAVSQVVGFQYRRHPASLSSLAGGDALRYQEEIELFASLQKPLLSAGYSKAARNARMRITSRLAALVDAARLLMGGKTKHLGKLLKLALGK